MRQVLVVLLALVGLAACTATVEPREVKVVVPAIGTASPAFCPPGQAKKGNC